MEIKQLSVFIENRTGRMNAVSEVLGKNNINIVSLSLADTNEFGLLRMIVSDPEKARTALKEEGYASMLNDVFAIRIENKAGAMQKAVKIMSDAQINIEYMYAFANGIDAAAVLKSDEPGRVVDILTGCGFTVYSADEAYSANV